MANQVLTISMITSEALPVLENQLVMGKYVLRDYDDQFAKEGAKIGATINVRLPTQYSGRTGAALAVEDNTEISVPVVLTTQYGVDVSFTTQEMTLSVDDFKARILNPQMANIANKVDSDLCNLYWDVANETGTPGTAPATFAAILAPAQRLNEESADKADRVLILDPRSNAAAVAGLSTLFAKQSSLNEQYGSGNLADIAGFGVGMDQNIFTHTVGPLGGSPVINGASQGLASGWAETGTLVTNGWTAAAASRLKKGDVFTIGSGATGVFAVNRQSRKSTNVLKQFVVTADTSSDASGNLTIPMKPALIFGGAYQNVIGNAGTSGSPATSATINVVGTASTAFPQSLAFQKNAFCLASADLMIPGGVDMAARKSYKGISMRLVRAYDINTDRLPSRFDILYGVKTVQPNLACRVTG